MGLPLHLHLHFFATGGELDPAVTVYEQEGITL